MGKFNGDHSDRDQLNGDQSSFQWGSIPESLVENNSQKLKYSTFVESCYFYSGRKGQGINKY